MNPKDGHLGKGRRGWTSKKGADEKSARKVAKKLEESFKKPKPKWGTGRGK